MIPILSLAVYHIFAYMAKYYSNTSLWHKYGAPANAWLNARQVSTCKLEQRLKPDMLSVLILLETSKSQIMDMWT